LTDNAGAIQTQYSYGPSGVVSVSGAASTNPYQFKGMQNDATGAYYGAGAYYNPTSGTGVGKGVAKGPASGSTSFATLSSPSPPAALLSGNGGCDKCEAKLEYGTVKNLPIPNNFHAYWWVKDPSGSVTISGEPEHPSPMQTNYPGDLDFGHLILQYNVDPPDGPIGPKGHYGPTSECCTNVSQLESAASTFPGYLHYNPVLGPNSNSTAHYLGTRGGFSPLIAPTRGIAEFGWDFIIP
jgi:hypothetical protein